MLALLTPLLTEEQGLLEALAPCRSPSSGPSGAPAPAISQLTWEPVRPKRTYIATLPVKRELSASHEQAARSVTGVLIPTKFVFAAVHLQVPKLHQTPVSVLVHAPPQVGKEQA